MTTGPNGDVDIAAIASVLADPTRVRFLLSLHNSAPLPAGELARVVGVSRPSASFHLAKLVDGGLVTVESQGRYRLFRLASENVALALEMLATIAPTEPVSSLRQALRADAIKFGRLCQEHVGGRLAVRIREALQERGVLVDVSDGYELTDHGVAFLGDLGLDMSPHVDHRFVEKHPDWSERSQHMAGTLATSIASLMLERDWIREVPASRAVRLTERGRAGLRDLLGLELSSVH